MYHLTKQYSRNYGTLKSCRKLMKELMEWMELQCVGGGSNNVILKLKQRQNLLTKPMASPKNSILIQQLCKHIAVIEQMNVKLHEQINSFDQEKQLVYRALGKTSWHDLLADLTTDKINIRSVLQDTTTTCKSGPAWAHSDPTQKSGREFYQTPFKPNKDDSVFESPIESESRLINRSIRGDTDRNLPEELPQWNDKYSKIMNEKIITLRDQYQNESPNLRTDNFLLTLNNLATHSMSKESLNLKNTQQQNMLLSIENTKLRQRVAKLEAIVESRQLCQ